VRPDAESPTQNARFRLERQRWNGLPWSALDALRRNAWNLSSGRSMLASATRFVSSVDGNEVRCAHFPSVAYPTESARQKGRPRSKPAKSSNPPMELRPARSLILGAVSEPRRHFQIKGLHLLEEPIAASDIDVLRRLTKEIVEDRSADQPLLCDIPFAQNELLLVDVRRIVADMMCVKAGFEIEAIGAPWFGNTLCLRRGLVRR
jgi:hypothetical protein